jgi:selenide,water dikinase
VLRHHRAQSHPSLLVGLEQPDDAAVWKLDGARAIVQTVDFFPPVVDDPVTFGRIGAANALSDIYAMGGSPFMALAIATFPDDLPLSILGDILRGGAEAAASVGVVVAGGHTVTDAEPKYGLCVTGLIDPHRILTKGALHAGDRLFLTKPIGTGVVTTAIKRGNASPEAQAGAIASMSQINVGAARVLANVPEVRACTDITGYGLAGHGAEMAIASRVMVVIEWARVPLLPEAQYLARLGNVPGGMIRNREFLLSSDEPGTPRVSIATTLNDEAQALAFDPQTSGGLLFGAPAASVSRVIDAFADADVAIAEIGEVRDGSGLRFV